uniref:Uncharacterized protein n=1 Tax=Siphoviridae sp. ctiam3 TaxID=2825624 RepID=A0A8S5P731_9CAUD|nr:MAG TPA: hypothetical protein [Siphoviridae sp. ctiam3]
MTTIWFAIMCKSFFVMGPSCRGSFSVSTSPPPFYIYFLLTQYVYFPFFINISMIIMSMHK